MSHILMTIVFGLISLGVLALAGYLVAGRPGMEKAARIFIWVWLAAAVINGGFGVVHAGIPVINEIGAFVPIFGIPAVAAWFLARWSGNKG